MSNSILDQYTLNWIQRHKSKGTIIRIPMSKARRRVLRRIFDGFDADGGGSIDFEEFYSACKYANPKQSREEIMQLFKELDLDEGGAISFEEFCAGMAHKDSENAMSRQQNGSSNESSKKKANIQKLAIDHQRAIQSANIKDKNIKDTTKLNNFRALFKTHALSFPSNNEADEAEALAEKQAHLNYLRSRSKETKGANGKISSSNIRSHQCIIGMTNDATFPDNSNIEEIDFDDILLKPITYVNLGVSLNKIDNLNPNDPPLEKISRLKILIADSNFPSAKLQYRTLCALGHDVVLVNPGEVVEDLLYEGSFDILLIETTMPNHLSGKPVVRHLRDYELDSKRKIDNEKKSEGNKAKKSIDKALELLAQGNARLFPSTHVIENKSSPYLQSIRLKSIQEMKLLDEERRTLDQEFLESNGIIRLNTYRKKPSPAKILNDGLRVITTAKTNSTFHSQFSSNETDSTSSDSFIILPSHSEPSFSRASTTKNLRSNSAINLTHPQKLGASFSPIGFSLPPSGSSHLKSPATAPSLSFKSPISINQSNSSHHGKTIRLQSSSHSYM